jgi:hypothetical protein
MGMHDWSQPLSLAFSSSLIVALLIICTLGCVVSPFNFRRAHALKLSLEINRQNMQHQGPQPFLVIQQPVFFLPT